MSDSFLPVEGVVEDREDLNEDVRVEVREVVPDVFKDGKHYVQAEKEKAVDTLNVEQTPWLSQALLYKHRCCSAINKFYPILPTFFNP